MDKIRGIKLLDELLWNGSLLEIVKPLTRAYIVDNEFEHSHTLLFGRSTYITRMVARKHIVGERQYKTLSFVVVESTYKSFTNPMFIELDINVINVKTVIDIIKPILKVRPVSNKKHRILIHNICYASKNLQYSFRKLIELYCDNAYIVFTAEKIDCIDNSLKSRLTQINCNVQKDSCHHICLNLIKNTRKDIQSTEYDKIIGKVNGDLLNLAIILELDNPLDYHDLLETFIDNELKNLCNICKSEYDTSLRDMCYKVSAICANIKDITNAIILKSNLSDTQYHQIIKVATKADTEIEPSNKIFFSLEMFFNEIVQILKN